MAKFTTKQIMKEAVRINATDFNPNAPLTTAWDGCPFDEVPGWLSRAWDEGVVRPHNRGGTDYAEWDIKTLHGTVSAGPGDWIVRNPQGDLYPCKPDIFAATYSPVGEDGPADESQSKDAERWRWFRHNVTIAVEAGDGWTLKVLTDSRDYTPIFKQGGLDAAIDEIMEMASAPMTHEIEPEQDAVGRLITAVQDRVDVCGCNGDGCWTCNLYDAIAAVEAEREGGE